ncbi:hypothetical protein FSP39_002452 [Pinctada imbricata]|uniref:Uncharacterized protein n=1 Tax=Pinctada imbricata TaxID=66713 RepID=A0AA88XTD4_PINIB|nr:hypothetical protein FSP39_002452 [Pinctada imbricata]
MEDKNKYAGLVDESYPDVFNIKAMPTQPPEKKPGQLPEHMIRKFFEEGYILIENFFDVEKELNPVREDINQLVDELAQKLYTAGKLKKLYKEYGLFERLTKIEAEFPGSNILLHKTGKLPPSFRRLWTNERLLNLMEQLIGPEVAISPVWNLRTKTPKNTATVVPWHQDNGYFDLDSYNTLIPTAWIPLLDTNEFNGGMEMCKNAHLKGKVAKHQCCWGDSWYVMMEEEEMVKTLGVDMKKDTEVCPVAYGGMLLFNNLTPHRSLPNVSNQVRWSLDLRWQSPDHPYGLFGLKDGMLVRSAKNPDIKADWNKFESVDRTTVQQKSVEGVVKVADDHEFDTTIQGPWMKKWELTHHNVHTQAHEKAEKGKS